jgi:hypothetical protein
VKFVVTSTSHHIEDLNLIQTAEKIHQPPPALETHIPHGDCSDEDVGVGPLDTAPEDHEHLQVFFCFFVFLFFCDFVGISFMQLCITCWGLGNGIVPKRSWL